MATTRVSLKDFAKSMGEFNTTQIKNYRKIAANAVASSIPALVAASPVDTGLYAQSWGFSIEEDAVILGNYAPHAAIIEDGARPFTPPLGPLLAWAKRVLKDGSQPPDYSPEVWALAVGTQKKIAAVGMKPKHIMANEIPKIIEKMKKELQKLG